MYNDAKYFVGSRWYDVERKQEVELVYCRNNTTVRPWGKLSDKAYYIPYKDLGWRLFKLKDTRQMIEIRKAVSALKHDIRKLEDGKVSVDKLIVEKQKQIEEFLLLIEKVNGNKERRND